MGMDDFGGLPLDAFEEGSRDEVPAIEAVKARAASRRTTVVEDEPDEVRTPASRAPTITDEVSLEEAARFVVAPEEERAADEAFEQPEVTTAPDHRALPARVSGWRAALDAIEERRGLQFALIVATGLAGWWVFGAPVEAPETTPKSTSKKATGFPVFKSQEEDGVAEQDIGELLHAAAAKEARREAEARALEEAMEAEGEASAPLHVLRPGEIYDPDDDETLRVPVAPRPPPEPPRAPVDQSIFFSPGGVLELPEGYGTDKTERGLGLPIGTRLAVRLLVGASSTNRRPVLAKVVEPVRVDGTVKVKPGAIVRGRATADAATGRLYIDFDELRFEQARFALEGYAVSDGDMPGLVARRREASFEDRVGSGGLGGAVGAGGEIAGEVAGSGVVGKVVRKVAQGTVPEAQREVAADPGVTFEVAAGTAFEVLVVGDGR